VDEVAVPAGEPVRIGRRWRVVPPGGDQPSAPGVLSIQLLPGRAFGTGTHPSTQLCLIALGSLVQPGVSVLDLGTGTGILAIGAALLGAGPVLALDIDPAAVQAARANVALNGVARQVQVSQGSLGDVIPACSEPGDWQVVVVNILSGVILTMFEQGLSQAVAPGGWLVLSGFVAAQSPEIRARLRRHSLELAALETRSDWVGIVARRATSPAETRWAGS
jgi:ribosomal protein L11 methyltransferase